MSKPKTAKQLEEEARQQMHGGDMFLFTPEELQIYRSQLLREQRKICADESGVDESSGMYESIINAPEPE